MCPYGTYQRALASANLTIPEAVSNPSKFEEAMLSRLSKKGKADEAFRKRFLAEARKHLKVEYEMMVAFRF